jgi:hypothetical protein
MTMMTGSFDASQFQPRQGGEAHPVGRYPFTISNTKIVQTKDGTGGMFVVTFQSDRGEIDMRYNIWNQSAKAVEIAHGQLSALCHAIGIFKVEWTNEGAIIRGARGVMDINYQKGEEPTAEKPSGGYVEVKKVFSASGNEPGKGPVAPQQTPPNNAPAPASGGWGGQQTAAAPNGQSGQPSFATGQWAPNPTASVNPDATKIVSNPPWAR